MSSPLSSTPKKDSDNLGMITVPYFQFVPNAASYAFDKVSYKAVPNKKIHCHCPLIIIEANWINEPMMDVAVASLEEEEAAAEQQIAAKEKERLDYLASQKADPSNKTQQAVLAAKQLITEAEDVEEAGLSAPDSDSDVLDTQNPETQHLDTQSMAAVEADEPELPEEDKPSEEISEEDQLKKDKEAKLESYKQFVAEQQSQVDIDYQGIRVNIEANALPSRMYFIMNALSAIIASYGLVINSAAVVIGAMLVAMMLGPISGVALAIIDYRMPFLRKSLLTVLAGGAMVVVIGFVVGFIHQDTPLTNEILSRTQPTSMDLMIALAGGTAGAYAMISPHLSVAVVGVAVATALVPPLAASGILFAHGEGTLGLGALLLALTNIIAIQFTNALVLWFTGFRRLMEDDYKSNPTLAFLRRNAVPLLLLTSIGVYLTYNFNAITKKQNFETQVKESINDYFIDQGNSLTATQFVNRDGYQMVRAVVRGETRPSPRDAQQLERQINDNLIPAYPKQSPVRIQLRYMPVVVIDSSPGHGEELDKTDAAILANE
jgi:uncharacterized hydrophobic protein (TIGR00271 family)